MIIELQSDSSLAKIETFGAELISFKDVLGQEYMWQKDAKYWAKCSPVLFPAIGNLRNGIVKIKGENYAIPKHGFCKDKEFKVMYQSKSKVILNCSYDADTLKLYPYKFSLTLTYTLTGGEIEIGYTVLNLDEQPINYCIGAHPAFNVPIGEGSFEDFCLEFNKNEDSTCPIYDSENLQIDVNKRIDYTKGGNMIQLSYSNFDSDAIIFDTINSNSVKLKSIKTGRGIQFDFMGFDSIAFWTPTKKAAPFICIEPWNGMAVRSDEDDDYANKFGVKHLAINEQHNYKITVIPM
ncbi:MAG: aldose 1-epimerase family protein [Oscillospiraceae bacterium]